MIVIGHSMGGILTNTQIRSSGDSLAKLAFTRPIDEVEGFTAEEKEGLKELMLYEANPDITRVVFIASPHRGSDIAVNPIGRLGSKLIKAPKMILKTAQAQNVKGLTPLGQKVMTHRPDSIQGLKPDNPGTKAILAQKVRKGVKIHSIIGR